MIIGYLGPGVGIGGVAVLLGVVAAVLFVFYSFVCLPLVRLLRRKRLRDKDE